MLVIVRRGGQLGNRLCLFAHVIAFAVEHQVRVADLVFSPYEAGFKNTLRDPFCRFPAAHPSTALANPPSPAAQRLARLSYRSLRAVCRLSRKTARCPRCPSPLRIQLKLTYGGFDMNVPDFIRLTRRTPLVLLDGWAFTDHTNIRRHAATVREYFQPVDAVREAAEFVVQRARQECDLLIGVHIRQGDYREHWDGIHFFETSQYVRLMREVAERFAPLRVGFLVCSNQAQEPTHFAGLPVHYGPGNLFQDLIALSLCDRIIGPLSTFSGWASFYGEVPLLNIRRATPESEPQFMAADFQVQYPCFPVSILCSETAPPTTFARRPSGGAP